MAERRTYELGRMTWKEIEQILPRNPVLLIPIGTVEEHGPHLPVNADNLAADFVARRAAEATDAYLVPAINYGYSPLCSDFPGTISIRPETLTLLVRDVCGALVRQGFRRFIFVNNHGGNQPSCEQVARELKAEHGLIIGNIYPWTIGYAVMRDAYDEPAAVYGHGGEPETSAMMAMYPDDVVTSLMASRDPVMTGPFKPRRDNLIEIPGQSVGGTIFYDYGDFFPNGTTGDPTQASAEKGRMWIERVVSFAIDFVKHYDNATAAEPWARRPGDPQVREAD